VSEAAPFAASGAAPGGFSIVTFLATTEFLEALAVILAAEFLEPLTVGFHLRS